MFRGDHPELSRTLARAWTLAADLGPPAHLRAGVPGPPADAGTGVFPLGAARARRRCARLRPPIGLDAQAVYAASLRLALARWERHHRPEHLALTLVALDPGAHWVLHAAGVDTAVLLGDLLRHSRHHGGTCCCGPSGGSASRRGVGTSHGATRTRPDAPPPKAQPSPRSSTAETGPGHPNGSPPGTGIETALWPTNFGNQETSMVPAGYELTRADAGRGRSRRRAGRRRHPARS